MLRILAAVAICSAVAVTTGCVSANHGDVRGGLFTSTVSTAEVVDNQVGDDKTGESSSSGILFFATGDSSVSAAMEAGGLTKVNRVESKVFSILTLYASHTTVVYGE